MFALAEVLQNAGFFAVPARTVQEAESLLDALGVVAETLLVNPKLPESERIAELLRQRNPELRVLPLEAGWISGEGIERLLDPGGGSR